MKVEQLVAKNFRNIRESTFYPCPGVNFLVGSNGQGKTSFLEALGFLSTLRSFRNSKAIDVVRQGTTESTISCVLTAHDPSSGSWRTDLKVHFQSSPLPQAKVQKTALINEKPFRSSTLFLSQRFGSAHLGFHTVIFNPSDHDLIRGEPSHRRSYIDQVIAAEDVEYLKVLQKYHRILIQRNALLKTGSTPSQELWQGFTEPLCHFGSVLTHKRLNWINRINPLLKSTMKGLTASKRDVRMGYLSNWVPEIQNLSFNNNKLNSNPFAGQVELPSLKLLEESFWSRLAAVNAAERKIGHSLVGPHRDDWMLFQDDQVLKGKGSQGEIRSALLSLKLSEIDLFRRETGNRPVFLLDDFSSELDRERRSFLLQFLLETDLQTFVTTTEESSFVGERYWVKNGDICNDY